jgi:YedE family putative selenium metabolism protein
MPAFDRHFWLIVFSGASLGLLGVLLAFWGNPDNSGICVSCFVENTAGAIGLHDNTRMQYIRPELIGFIFGAIASAVLLGEFRSKGGSAPLPRFLSGVFLIIGCAVFIGCPIKLFLRLTAGDLTTIVGLAGLVAGVWIGIRSLSAGVHLGRNEVQRGSSGLWVPALFLFFLLMLFLRPGFVQFSETGSAALHAPLLLSLAAGLFLGFLAQRSRFCITASVRDFLLMGGRAPLAWGLLAFSVVAIVANLATGGFRLGYYGQPGSHLEAVWSFLGMGLVGWLSVIIGGCPFRQIIKAGEGDADAGMVVLGMLVGGGLVQSWDIAATAAGVTLYGKVAVLVGILFVLLNSIFFREKASS